ncbi:MAG: SDR family oxidoreductase [Chloroherpetonaceae bacterium]|nr:SDR family oxidoreductase [Chloroherpetonaceae bacterium]MDW8437542.1 SDR family oxidoreductase [Chloroherpetonaceae bacterium]
MKKFNGKVLVVGATGRTGLWVLRRLQAYDIPARAFARKADKLAEFRDLEVSLGKIQNASAIRSAVKGCDAIICAIGATALFGESSPVQVDGDGIIRLVDIAKENNVKKFILISSIAVTKPLHPLNLAFGGVLSQKLRSENHLRKIYGQDGFAYTIIRPGGLKDGEPFKHQLQTGKGDTISGVIDRADVAELAVLSLWVKRVENETFEVIRSAPAEQKSLELYLEKL